MILGRNFHRNLTRKIRAELETCKKFTLPWKPFIFTGISWYKYLHINTQPQKDFFSNCFWLMWCHLAAIPYINNDYTVCLLFNYFSYRLPKEVTENENEEKSCQNRNFSQNRSFQRYRWQRNDIKRQPAVPIKTEHSVATHKKSANGQQNIIEVSNISGLFTCDEIFSNNIWVYAASDKLITFD